MKSSHTRSPAQKAAWEKFRRLGELTSLDRWIKSKIPDILRDPALDKAVKVEILFHAEELCKYLQKAATLAGWVRKS